MSPYINLVKWYPAYRVCYSSAEIAFKSSILLYVLSLVLHSTYGDILPFETNKHERILF